MARIGVKAVMNQGGLWESDKERRRKPVRSQVDLWPGRGELLSRGRERARRGSASRGWERCSLPAQL